MKWGTCARLNRGSGWRGHGRQRVLTRYGLPNRPISGGTPRKRARSAQRGAANGGGGRAALPRSGLVVGKARGACAEEVLLAQDHVPASLAVGHAAFDVVRLAVAAGLEPGGVVGHAAA